MVTVLSPRQYNLLLQLYQQFTSSLGPTTLDQFCRQITKKELNQLTPQDMTKIIKYTNNNIPASRKQRDFLDEIFAYLEIDGQEFCSTECRVDMPDLTRSQVNTVIQKLKDQYGVFVPQKIRLQNYTLSVIQAFPHYKIIQQTYKYNPDKKLTVISFRDLLVCDWDNLALTEIQATLSQFPYSFMIYKTHKGYHGYCISHTFDHRAFSTHQLMHKLGCDPWYISFTKLNGFVTRISKKSDRQEEYIEQFVATHNTRNNPKPELLELVKIKDTYTVQQ
ncbi:MAG: hypothetical protein EBU90_04890 [Proteobacteria bacterium]|nr:hypothetical protein [Pseudomonadota bacterium]NBP13745.1 hypothetical protein [bacterium]